MNMSLKWLSIGAVFIVLIAAFGCSGDSSTPTTPSTPTTITVNSVTVTGASTLTSKGQTTQLTATANMSNGTTQDVTSQATWQSDNQSVVSVSSSGLATANADGQATITATYQTKSGTLQIKVELPKKAVPEWTVTLYFKTSTNPNNKYSAQSIITWAEKGGVYGMNVTSFSIHYFNDAGNEFIISQSWTANSISKAWGGSNHINAGGSKNWEINYPFNIQTTKLTAEYKSKVVDDLGNTTELTGTKTASLTQTKK